MGCKEEARSGEGGLEEGRSEGMEDEEGRGEERRGEGRRLPHLRYLSPSASVRRPGLRGAGRWRCHVRGAVSRLRSSLPVSCIRPARAPVHAGGAGVRMPSWTLPPPLLFLHSFAPPFLHSCSSVPSLLHSSG